MYINICITISWAYQTLAPKTADNRGLTVVPLPAQVDSGAA